MGGLYSSTATTVVLAKHAKDETRPHLFSGAILIASSVMYLRILVLVALFSRELARRLLVPIVVLAVAGTVVGFIWAARRDRESGEVKSEKVAGNPLELRSAFFFAVIFVLMLALTHYAVVYLGRGGVYALAAFTGFTDISPFILGLANTVGSATPLALAAGSVMVAAASNNIVKGGYAYAFGDRKTGVESASLLLIYTVLGLLPLFWLAS